MSAPQQLRPCCRCVHWQAVERGTAYMCWCPIAERRTQFDETCGAWQAPGAPAPVRTDVISQWQGYWTGGKKP